MKSDFFALFTALFTFIVSAQEPAPITPASAITQQELLQYEGHYEYEAGSELDIVAPPNELVLYAIIDDAKYPLRPVQADTFLNSTQQRIVFVRDKNIIGFRQPDSDTTQLFRRLGDSTKFPAQMWYPRMPGVSTRLSKPLDRHDGLIVADITQSGLDVPRLDEMVQALSRGSYPNVHSVLIIKNSKLVLEEYFYEFSADSLHPMRSATKSLVSTLTGIAIDRGILKSTDVPLLAQFTDDYPSIANLSERKKQIAIEHLLTQTTGLDCNDWDSSSAGNESRVAHDPDWIKTFLDLPALSTPGSTPSYCSLGVITLGRTIEKAAKTPLEQFAKKELFEPLAINEFGWRFDPDPSSAHTFTQISLRPRDMAKFALLIKQKGKWNDRQIVSAEWVERAIATHTQLDNTDYGYLWWKPYLNVNGKKYNAILATGNGGQKIYIWPELDMITVFTGGNYNRETHVKTLLTRYILPTE